MTREFFLQCRENFAGSDGGENKKCSRCFTTKLHFPNLNETVLFFFLVCSETNERVNRAKTNEARKYKYSGKD